MEDESKFVPMGTKVAPWAAEVWNAICDALDTDTYHLLQQFIYAMIRAASSQHEKSPEIERLLNVLDLDVGWQKAINLVAPNGKLTIAQMLLVVQQEGKSGLAATLLDKPFMDDCRQTEKSDDIFERVMNIIYPRTYFRMRLLKQQLHIESPRQLLEVMLDTQRDLATEEADREVMEGINDFAPNNRRVVYGKKSKRSKHYGIDSKGFQKKIVFNNSPEINDAYGNEEE